MMMPRTRRWSSTTTVRSATGAFERLEDFFEPGVGADGGDVAGHERGDRCAGARRGDVAVVGGKVIVQRAKEVYPAEPTDEMVLVIDHGQPFEVAVGHELGRDADRIAGADVDRGGGHDVLGSQPGLLQLRDLGLDLRGGEFGLEAEPGD